MSMNSQSGNLFDVQSSSTSTSLPITRESEEWGVAESLLNIIFRTSNISLRSLWSVSNPGILARFQRRSRDSFSVFPTVISGEDLAEAGETLTRICDVGLPLNPEGGIRVRIGNVSLPGGFLDGDTEGVRQMGRGRRMFEMLIAKVMVGKSFAGESDDCDRDKVQYMKNLDIAYDSVLLMNERVDEHISLPKRVGSSHTSSSHYLPPHAFSQTYILRSGDQILPMFMCRFEVDIDRDECLSLGSCQSCQVEPATIWCAADEAGLCPKCDEINHSVNKITMRHIRVPINERPQNGTGPCSLRPDLSASLWNDTKGIAISEESRKEYYPTTMFADISDAYKSSVRIACQGDTDLGDLKAILLTRLRAQDEVLSHLTRTFKETEESAYRKTATVLQKTLALTERKTQSILQKEQDLEAQIQFIQWAEELISPFAKSLSPTEWMELWLEHYRLVKSSVGEDKENDRRTPELVSGEIKIDGQFTIKQLS
jgi:hypothetical protein